MVKNFRKLLPFAVEADNKSYDCQNAGVPQSHVYMVGNIVSKCMVGGAHPSKQRALKSLANSGRLEITTGGWVMTDEANAHLYAMVDQLIEGHQWAYSNLEIKPKSGWSIDPFGHGSTQPYLMALSGIKGTVIQRIHYAWKQWLAYKQYGDFKWIPNWSPSDRRSVMLTHNQPFDIYSIKHSCGPHPYICLNFDFRKVAGEYTEYSIKAQPITDKNVKEKSELLLEQYARTGSLFPHNVVLMPLGDDFRYNIHYEWDQQFTNYIKLINYINSHKDVYKAEVVFGTPNDYFEEIQKRYDQYPTLKGDFFVYSDIFSEGRPAYWSGYYTTRPFMKILDRELENNLRAAEIVYTVALNQARQKGYFSYLKILERDYEKLVQARRNLGLFQHHDAITGTSKSFVMRDYGLKLFESIHATISIQQNALQSLLFGNKTRKPNENIILSDVEMESYDKLPKQTILSIEKDFPRQIILFNSLAQTQEHLVQLRVTTQHIKVTDKDGNPVLHQINPIWNSTDNNKRMTISDIEYELMFIAKIPALTITTYNISYSTETGDSLATIYCNKCHMKNKFSSVEDNTPQEPPEFLDSSFKIKNTQTGDIQLENHKFKILFNGKTGFMKSVTQKRTLKIIQCAIQFAAYRSAQYHSGAYLFMPDPNERDVERDVLLEYKDHMSIIINSGQIASELTVIYGVFLVHTIRIYHPEQYDLSQAIYIENEIDFENPPKNRETELFMRFISDIQNGEQPEIYTDSNGFQMQKRVKVEQIGVEGNYFPITTMAYIEDELIRLSLITNHAQGAASWQPGYLEVMLDRRTLYDDSRGMGEGVIDNRKTVNKFWLLLEDLNTEPNKEFTRFANHRMDKRDTNSIPEKEELFSRPTLYANHLSNVLNYPTNIFIVGEEFFDIKMNKHVSLINKEFPCDVHLLTLRTQPDIIYTQFPSNNALMVLHRQGYSCKVANNFTCKNVNFQQGTRFELLDIKELQPTTLTGLDPDGSRLNDLSNIFMESMTLQTYNVTFV
ncbi:alpha-mannosidase [Holotrichia oblita]|uniref:Alpha-mannosidase n=2 Tax=Holotrichia oblita TaxID=644536 RepID=A0ACB9TEE6_HOLOL|nr:alpha-mannosidase [Holotrichia oblita]